MSQTLAISEGAVGFDPRRLGSYLQDVLTMPSSPLSIERIAGGQSNPTFFVTCANQRMVLRQKPMGETLPSAHAIDREYRVLSALAGTRIPVPKPIAYCESAAVIGAPFYLMERLEGRIFPGYATPGLAPLERSALYRSMAETLAALHNIDWRGVGLTTFGRTGGYCARQIARWTDQWRKLKSRDNPEIDAVIAWLLRNVPTAEVAALCHGDFRLGNLVIHPSRSELIGVLDWELSTIGDPRVDLAFNCVAWRTLPQEYGGLLGLDLGSMGIPSEAEYLDLYRGAAGDVPVFEPFHMVLALFRFAIIFHGIGARARAGNAAAENARDVAELAVAFAHLAYQTLRNA